MTPRLHRPFFVNANERQISLKRNYARRRKEHGRFQRLEKERLCRQTMERFSRTESERTRRVR